VVIRNTQEPIRQEPVGRKKIRQDPKIEEDTCPICLDRSTQKDGAPNWCTTSCNHSFCLSCLSISLQNNTSCPLCREPLVPENKKVISLAAENETLRDMYFGYRHQLDRAHLTIDGLHDNMHNHQEELIKMRDRLMSKTHELDIVTSTLRKTIKKLSDMESSIGEDKPFLAITRYDMSGKIPQHKSFISPRKLCCVCGCSQQFDNFGDRVCFCDSCSKYGCTDEKIEWKRNWTNLSADALKENRIKKART